MGIFKGGFKGTVDGRIKMSKLMTSEAFFKNTLKTLSDKARSLDLTGDELVMIPELMEHGSRYVLKWLGDEEFKAAFKGNTTGYYLGLCANCIGGGMMFADAWADSANRLAALEYDSLYEGSVWENIFALAEVTDNASKTELRQNIIALFETWVKMVYEYLSLDNAGDYLIESFRAFFYIGAGIRLYNMGY